VRDTSVVSWAGSARNSGVSDVFRRKVEKCFNSIAVRIAACLDGAVTAGELAPRTDTRAMADLLINCWGGPLCAVVFGAIHSRCATCSTSTSDPPYRARQ
jgi:hypothetical protein